MTTTYRSEKLEQAFAALSANYRGTDIDLYAACRDRRAKTPVATGDFMNSIGVPTHAGANHGHPTFTLFKYNDVKTVLQDSATFNSRFMACAEQMGEALLVNPFSREELSDAIKRALTMPLEERKRKWECLMQVVRDTDVGIWRDAFVKALLAVETEPEKSQWAGAA